MKQSDIEIKVDVNHKVRKSIDQILYEDSKRLTSLWLFVKKHMRENQPCKEMNLSKEGRSIFNLDYSTEANSIAGYIESLQRQINELRKDGEEEKK